MLPKTTPQDNARQHSVYAPMGYYKITKKQDFNAISAIQNNSIKTLADLQVYDSKLGLREIKQIKSPS